MHWFFFSVFIDLNFFLLDDINKTLTASVNNVNSTVKNQPSEREEPEKIKIWREEQRQRLEEKGV